jgi:predicted regulator of Ras-like GTPase activity (Roadblock/LC7/MglB family)
MPGSAPSAPHQGRLKTSAPDADSSGVTDEITRSMQLVLHHLVEQTSGVTGALVASVDGFTLASRLAPDTEIDTAGLGAMSAAAMALSNQLVGTSGDAPAKVSHHQSPDGQVLILPVAHVAVLAVLATTGTDLGLLARASRTSAHSLQRLFRGVAAV